MKQLFTVSCLCILAACGGDVRESLGLNKQAPDEFNVVSRPPLSVPPEFYLEPPTPGAPPRFEGTQESQAKALILNSEGNIEEVDASKTVDARVEEVQVEALTLSADDLPTPQESTLLNKLKVADRDPDIRKKLYREVSEEPVVREDATPLEEWLGLADDSSVVDPAAEAERIRSNKDAGKPLNEGEVKTKENSKESVLEQLF